MNQRDDAPQQPFNYDQGENERDETYIRRLTRHAKALEARVSEIAPTQDRLHDIRIDALEEAALACEAITPEQNGPYDRSYTREQDAKADACRDCAEEIRALKNAAPQVAEGASQGTVASPVHKPAESASPCVAVPLDMARKLERLCHQCCAWSNTAAEEGDKLAVLLQPYERNGE